MSKTIGALDDPAALTGAEFFEIEQSSASFKEDLTAVKTWVFDNVPSFTVSSLPGSATEGSIAYATDGRKVGEGAGTGTGVPVYFSNSLWLVYSGDTQVLA